MAVPEFWLVAGPNGAGKTTLARAGVLPTHASHFEVLDNSATDEQQPPVLLASGGRGLLAMAESAANPVVAQALVGSPLFTHKLRFY